MTDKELPSTRRVVSSMRPKRIETPPTIAIPLSLFDYTIDTLKFASNNIGSAILAVDINHCLRQLEDSKKAHLGQ